MRDLDHRRLICPPPRHYSGFFFSMAVFKENNEVLSYCRLRRRRCAKTWTFCNISVITEDIYLKLGLVDHYEKGNLYQ